MFTGIIEELGEVKAITTSSVKSNIKIAASEITGDLKIGDSVAVNGACLTVSNLNERSFIADVMPQTFEKTNLGYLKTGERVNLERALRVSDRMGGHFVLGHVDQVGIVMEKKKSGNSLIFKISAPNDIVDYLVPRGSIAVDGVSLTVAETLDNYFFVSIIPHTAEVTTLGIREKGGKVNLEADIIGKYVKNLTELKEHKNSTLDLLNKYGYLE